MKTAIISFTERGGTLSLRLREKLLDFNRLKNVGNADTIELYGFLHHSPEGVEPFEQLSELTEALFLEVDAIIFIGAAGIAVRASAPFLKSKTEDPAVLVIDECGSYVIPILSGHIGGANEFSIHTAKLIGGVPVITTATDVSQTLAIDVWAKKNNLKITDMNLAKKIAVSILHKEPIGFYSDFGLDFLCPAPLTDKKEKTGVCVSYQEDKKPFLHTLHLVPEDLILGIGCRKGTDCKELKDFIETVLQHHQISRSAVKRICSIDLKKDEAAIRQLATEYQVPFLTFSKEELNSVQGEFASSEFVREVTGTDNVCERSAVLGGGLHLSEDFKETGEFIIRRTKSKGMTMALYKVRSKKKG